MTTATLRPMLATLGKPPTCPDFAVEAKYDGQRGMAVVDRQQVTLFSRNGADITRTFPEITTALSAAVGGRRIVLDGEIAALDDAGAHPSSGRSGVGTRTAAPPPNFCGKSRRHRPAMSNAAAEVSPAR
jgi:bifunctional non-homologous end joining protein LigD